MLNDATTTVPPKPTDCPAADQLTTTPTMSPTTNSPQVADHVDPDRT